MLGLVREIMAASLFGAGVAWDAFAFAFQIPNLFRRIFGEGALSAAFIPVFSRQLNQGPPEAAHKFMSTILSLLTLVTLGIMFVGIGVALALPSVAGSWAQDPVKMSLTCRLVVILMPYLPLICVVALLSAILNTVKHFLMPALASVVLNVCWIGGFAGAYALRDRLDQETLVELVAAAILVGGVLELVMQLPPLKTHGIRFRANLDLSQPGVKDVAALMAPTIFGLTVIQINLVVDNLVAEIFVPGHGAVAMLYFGNRLMQFPLALIGIALAQAVFPYLSDAAAQGDLATLGKHVSRALRLCLFVAMPATAGLVVLAGPSVDLLFRWGKFDPDAALRTARVVAAYGCGVWAYCCIHVTTRAYHAMKDTRTPVRVGATMVAANCALNLALVGSMREAGLALATSICAVANLLILLRGLKKKAIPGVTDGVSRAGWTAAAASVAMAAVCWGALELMPSGENARVLVRALRVVVPIGIGAGAFLAIARVLGMDEAREVLAPVLRKLGWKRAGS